MTGISRIIARIDLDAEEQCAKIDAQSAADLTAIREKYAAAERERYAAALRLGAEEANTRFERARGAHALDFQKRVLAEKQLLMGETFDAAVTALRELPQPRYCAFLAKLAYSNAKTGSEALIFSPADRDEIGALVTDAANTALKTAGRPALLTLSADTRDIPGGLIVSGGDIEVNCSLPALVGYYRAKFEPDVAEILFT
ncbi:MAG: V-type ATP synthase subunit E [Oscillospiraceae bacterium]|jgi:V/A-type H+-transporting ATPase subunit E|nr:V-type ATP synthase subunit E [Oscillospiraceae bacterium]